VGNRATITIAQRATLRAFGEPTQYPGGPPEGVSGIFDAAYVRVEAGRPGVQSAGPAVFYLLEDLPSDPREVEPTIVIRGESYKPHEVKADGQGGILLHLHRA
jgi:hypothetical protein